MSDELIDQLMRGMPESWDDDVSAESLVIDYVREIERRLVALGGTLERVGKVGSSTVAGRREEAREAFWHKSSGTMAGANDGLAVAVAVATTVRVTPAATEAFRFGWDVASARRGGKPTIADRRHAGLAAALRELGFEVVS